MARQTKASHTLTAAALVMTGGLAGVIGGVIGGATPALAQQSILEFLLSLNAEERARTWRLTCYQAAQTVVDQRVRLSFPATQGGVFQGETPRLTAIKDDGSPGAPVNIDQGADTTCVMTGN